MGVSKTNDPILKHGEQYEHYYTDLQTARDNYAIAQEYYVKLRNSFLQDVSQNMHGALSEYSSKAISDKFVEIISNEIDSKSVEEMKKQISAIQETLPKFLNKNSSVAQTVKKALIDSISKEKKQDSDVSTRVHNFQDRLNRRLGEAVSDEIARNAYNTIISLLSEQGLLSQQGQMTSAEHGFLKRNLLLYFKSSKGIAEFYKGVSDRIFSDHSLIGYAKNIGGAYVERLKTDAINSAIQQLTQISPISFQTTASSGDSTNIHYDILSNKIKINNSHYLQNIQQFLESANELNVTGVGIAHPNEFAYGIQSKQGWSNKLLNVLNNKTVKLDDGFFSVGSRIQLANSLGFKNTIPSYWRGWHNSIAQLSKLTNFFQAIGQFQLGFFVHGAFVWMSDLIAIMRRNNLYMAFYYPRRLSADQTYKTFTYPTSGEVAWQSPSYNYREISRAKILAQYLASQNKSKTKKRSKKK